MNRQENIKRFEELMGKVNRDGMDELMKYIRESDFYSAPASTRFHLSCEGGLLQHSLNVYDCLLNKAKHSPTWACILADAGAEALILCPLLHDLCKTHFYAVDFKNQKTYDQEKVKAAERWQVKHDNNGDFIWETVPCYTVNDKVPYGHGEKSVMMIEQFIKLTGPERFAIRWHMGGWDLPYQSQEMTGSQKRARELTPLITLIHTADAMAADMMERPYTTL